MGLAQGVQNGCDCEHQLLIGGDIPSFKTPMNGIRYEQATSCRNQ